MCYVPPRYGSQGYMYIYNGYGNTHSAAVNNNDDKCCFEFSLKD